jgi:hypothetical protein
MRKFVWITALWLAAAAAQGAEKTEILFQPKQTIPAHGGPAVKVARFGNDTAFLMGGCGRIALENGNMGVGFGGYSLATELLADVGGVKRDIGFSYGGIMLDRSFFARKLFYFNVNTMAGLGQTWAVSRLAGAKRDYNSFYFVEPELSLMLNVTGDLRVGIGGGYRLVFGQDPNANLGLPLDGPALTVTILYGKI